MDEKQSYGFCKLFFNYFYLHIAHIGVCRRVNVDMTMIWLLIFIKHLDLSSLVWLQKHIPKRHVFKRGGTVCSKTITFPLEIQ